MASDAVLNIRLPKELKAHGNQVLEKNGISVTQVVRNLYEYMERRQSIPVELTQGCDNSIFEERRRRLREAAGAIKLKRDFNLDDARVKRISSKHGEIE